MPNKLIHGDNLIVLKSLLKDYAGGIDLVYIDPPFATNCDFRVGSGGRTSTISSSRCDALAYEDTLTGQAFLDFLRERLVVIRELMSSQASIYLHIDYKIGHYVKVMMDEVFGIENFRNDITRVKCNPKNFHRKAYGNIKDMILFYAKSADNIWNDPRAPFTEDDEGRLFKKVDEKGRRYTTIPLHAPGETASGNTGKAWRGVNPPVGRHWRTDPSIFEEWDSQGLIEWSSSGTPRKKIFLEERNGKKMQDIWEFKDPQYPSYPTEKNLEMLRFIIEASSNEGDCVLDCFCGSGTTLLAAQQMGREWIGIDQSDRAIEVAKKRLSETQADLFSKNEFEVIRQADVLEKNRECVA
jgi:adenine-specific DNA-methyltransferase